MAKCAVALIYEGAARPYTLCLTDDQRLKVLVKRQVLLEAQQALNGAETLHDTVLIESFKGNLDKLQRTLDALIPPELEVLYDEAN